MNTVTAYQAIVNPSSPSRSAIQVGSTSNSRPIENEKIMAKRVSPAPRIVALNTTTIASNQA